MSPGAVLSLVPAALGVTFVGYTDNILTGRAFANRRDERIDAKRELLALGAANLASGLMHGFPVSSSGSRTAIGHAMGGRTQLTSLVTVVRHRPGRLHPSAPARLVPHAALGAVVVYAALRLIDVAEFRRLAGVPTHRAAASPSPPRSLSWWSGSSPGCWSPSGCRCSTCCGASPGRTTPSRASCPASPGMHDVDDYPGATVVPGLLVYRYDSPLFFANAEDFRRRALGRGRGRRRTGAVVRAQRRGDRRGRHHRGRRARGRCAGAVGAGHRRSRWHA